MRKALVTVLIEVELPLREPEKSGVGFAAAAVGNNLSGMPWPWSVARAEIIQERDMKSGLISEGGALSAIGL